MEELIIDKTFDTKEELEKFEKELCDEYIACMVFYKDQVIGEPEIYGISSILHFGKRK